MLSCALLGETGPPRRTSPCRRPSPAVGIILRGLLFVPAALYALAEALAIGYFGANPWLLLLLVALVPAALLCWMLASVTEAGDLWSAGYALGWVVITNVLPVVLDFFNILV